MIDAKLTALARRERRTREILVAIVEHRDGETVQLVGAYGPYANATITWATMLERDDLDELRAVTVRELLLTSALGFPEAD